MLLVTYLDFYILLCVFNKGACRVPNVESSGGSFGKLPLEIPAGREINFECQSGFYLKEGGVLVCQHNGIWTGEVPRCESMYVALESQLDYHNFHFEMTTFVFFL